MRPARLGEALSRVRSAYTAARSRYGRQLGPPVHRAEKRIDPMDELGADPGRAASYWGWGWGWGNLPDQCARRWDKGDGWARTPKRPSRRGLTTSRDEGFHGVDAALTGDEPAASAAVGARATDSDLGGVNPCGPAGGSEIGDHIGTRAKSRTTLDTTAPVSGCHPGQALQCRRAWDRGLHACSTRGPYPRRSPLRRTHVDRCQPRWSRPGAAFSSYMNLGQRAEISTGAADAHRARTT